MKLTVTRHFPTTSFLVYLKMLRVSFSLSIWKFNCAFAISVHSLYRAISKDALLGSAGVEVFDGLIRENNFFCIVWVMLLNLVAEERKRRLRI